MSANTHISYIETNNHSIQRDHVSEQLMGRWMRYAGVSDDEVLQAGMHAYTYSDGAYWLILQGSNESPSVVKRYGTMQNVLLYISFLAYAEMRRFPEGRSCNSNRDGVNYGYACMPSSPCFRTLKKNCTQHEY